MDIAQGATYSIAIIVQLQATANISTVSSSAGVGVTVGLGQNSGISFQLRAAQAQGRTNGTETTYDNTQVTASKNLTVKSGSDTNLIGAQLAGETVKMEVGTSGKGALNIETLQNTSTFKSEQSSSGFDVSLCIPPICYGSPAEFKLALAQQAIDHNYISAVGQSGIAAGKGGFDIAVAGNTDLKGAAITSTASADKNTLATQSLTSSDLANAQSTSSSSSSITVGNNMTAMVVGNVLANLAGKDGLPEDGSQSGKTLSVISPGAVTITGSGNASTDATSGQQVALLTSRDASTANGALTNTLTLQQAQGLQAKQKEIQENMQAGQLVGSVAYNMAGDIAAKNQWAESSPQKIALHAIAGFIQASAAGQNGATGALAGAANEALTKVVNDTIEKALPEPKVADPRNPTDDEKAKLRENAQSRTALAEGAAQLIGMGTVALGGGSGQDVLLGGAVALNADRFNRQLHPDERKLAAQLAAKSKGKYTTKQVEDAMRAAGNADKGESMVAGMVVDSAVRDAIYDKGAVWTMGEGGKLVQVLPSQPSVDLGDFIKANTGLTYNWYTPSAESATPLNAPRDRLTNMPLDAQGRYSRTVVLDGKMYEPKLHSCASAECSNNSANLDRSDPATQAYIKALDQQVFKDIGKGATAGTLVTPVGPAATVLMALGLAASGGQAATSDKPIETGFDEAMKAASEKGGAVFFEEVLGHTPGAAARASALINLAGGWDAFVNRVKIDVFGMKPNDTKK